MKIRRWHGVVVWALGTLFAIALIEEAPYAAVAVAVLGGIAFGLINWYALRESPKGSAEDVV